MIAADPLLTVHASIGPVKGGKRAFCSARLEILTEAD
jgi:hypothetical protein